MSQENQILSWDDLPDVPSQNKKNMSWDDLPDAPLSKKSGNDLKGWQGVSEDIGSSIAKAPHALKEFFMQLGPQLAESGQQVVTHPVRAAENLIAGALEGLKGMVNTPAIIAQYMQSKGLYNQGQKEGQVQIPIGDTGLQKKILGDDQKGDELIRGVGSFLPYGPLAGSGSGIAGMGRRAVVAGLQGVGQNQDPIVNALMSVALESAGKTAKKIPSGAVKLASEYERGNLTPTELAAKLLKSNLSSEELSRNLRAAQGTQTPIGRVIEKPSINALFENVTSHMPLSGSSGILDNLKQQVETKAYQTVESLAPEHAGSDLNNLTQSFIKNAFEKQKESKNNLFKTRNSIAEKEGATVAPEKFKNELGDIKESIEDSALYKGDPKFRRQYNQIVGYEKNLKGSDSPILDASGNKIKKSVNPSFTEAQVTASDFYNLGQKMKSSIDSKDRILGNNLLNLSKALRDDIKDSVKKGSKELQDSHEKANSEYKNNFSQFLDEDVFEKINQKNPEKIVNEIIKPGKSSDQYKRIEKIVNILPDEQKNILGYTYLSRAKDAYGKINPKELSELISSLGNRQLKALFPNENVRNSIQDFGKLRGMNEKALSVMFNPSNGQKALPYLQMGAFYHNPIATSAVTGASYLANKAFTNEALRAKIVNKMIENAKMREAKNGSR